MEDVVCNVCKSDDTSLLLIKDSLRIVKCFRCGLIYVNPRVAKEDLGKIYNRDYFDGSRQADFLAEKKLYLQRFQERLREIIAIKRVKGKLLDIGCAVGYFLEVVRREGWQASGVEISSFAAKYAKESGFDIFTGTIEEANYPAYSFDAATLWHTLEHMRDPLGSLEQVHRMLKKNGLIAIEVPNIGSREFRKQRENWDYLKPKEHLYYFTPEVLKKMVEKAGFKVIKVTTLPKGTGIGEKLGNLGLGRLKKQLVKSFNYLSWIKKSILYLKKFSGDDIILLYALK